MAEMQKLGLMVYDSTQKIWVPWQGDDNVASELWLVPKASSSGAEGTIFYCSTDDHVYVGTEA